MPIPSIITLRRELRLLRRSGKKWQEIGKGYPGVPIGTLCRIAKDKNYCPKRPDILKALGIPAYAPAPICPVHNVVHTGHCPRAKRVPQSLFDWTVKELKEALLARKLYETT